MAFETFLTVDKLKPRKGRRITFLVSLAVHGAMVVVGVAMSFAAVDELAPKNGRMVTFFDMPVAPPPPGDPKKSANKPKPKNPKIVRPTKNVLVQPTEKTKEETNEPDEPPCEGPQCSEIDGPGDEPGGRGEGPTVMLPPNVTKGFMVSNPQDPQHRPRLPPRVTRMGMSVSALLRVCVDREGNVVGVTVMRGDDQEVNDAFIAAARTWRYRPFKVDGRPVPFCTPVSFTVQTTN